MIDKGNFVSFYRKVCSLKKLRVGFSLLLLIPFDGSKVSGLTELLIIFPTRERNFRSLKESYLETCIIQIIQISNSIDSPYLREINFLTKVY